MGKSSDAFRTISEVADELGVPKHVLRFWESKFAQIRPMKRGGGRRFYRPGDMELLRAIRDLLHRDGYTIRGVQRILREQGVDVVKQRGKLQPASAAAKPRAARAQKGRDVGQSVPAARGAEAESAHAPSSHARPTGEVRKRILAAIAELEACQAILSDRTEQQPVRSRSAAR
jgi:DNA-binding transcriptional MerR regulator